MTLFFVQTSNIKNNIERGPTTVPSQAMYSVCIAGRYFKSESKIWNIDCVLTIKCIGVPGESGEHVTSLSSVIQRKGVGESLRARMSLGRSGTDETFEPSVLYPSKLKKRDKDREKNYKTVRK